MPYRPVVLCVEDDAAVRTALSGILARAGFAVCFAETETAAVDTALRRRPDLVLLDLALREGTGEGVIERLSASRYSPPTLVLTGVSDVAAMARLFARGARDFLVKPVEPGVLVIRLQAALRGEEVRTTIHRAGIVLDMRRSLVHCQDRTVGVTPKVATLLALMLGRIGELIAWEELASQVWGYSPLVRSNTYCVHVSRLRHVLRTLGAPLLVHAEAGDGVVLECVCEPREPVWDADCAVPAAQETNRLAVASVDRTERESPLRVSSAPSPTQPRAHV